MKLKKVPRLLSLILPAALLAGCVKDTCKESYTYTIYTPVYETVAQLKANIKSAAPEPIENAGKIVLLGNYIFLNEIERGIHIIDNSNPAAPKNMAFVNLPGNIDLAVRGNTLYADSYSDLATLDVSDPRHVTLKNYLENVMQFTYYSRNVAYSDGNKIARWDKRDTTLIDGCDVSKLITVPGVVTFNASITSPSVPAANNGALTGIAGSTSRFAITGNYLYTVNSSNLDVFDISNSNDPKHLNSIQVYFHVETIYPFQDKLFIGSNNGMFIYDLNRFPENPVKVGEFTHARSCDPVVSDGEYAYVTLHSGTTCLGYNNELDVVRLNLLVNATLVRVYNLTSPEGLSKDGDLLFICDGSDGLKVFDATDVLNIKLEQHLPVGDAHDVIARNHVALVVTSDALYQFDYSNSKNLRLLSKLSILNN